MSEEEVETSASESEIDSDTELQQAFSEGKLKGLTYKTKQKPKFINNKAALLRTLDRLKSNLGWIERMDLSVDPIKPARVLSEQLGENPDDLSGNEVHNDYKREMKFYRQAQAAVLVGCPRLHTLGVVTKRPDDYLAEMAKSDAHMDKVRKKILSVQEGRERSEKARKLREMKKYGKQVQREVLAKRQKEKKEMMNAVKAYKKGKTNSLDFLEENSGKNSKSSSQSNNKQQQPNKKRQARNSKFGFGGQKKRSKHNTSESVNDFAGVPRFSKGGAKGGAGGNKKKGANKRPGKRNRQKNKSRGK